MISFIILMNFEDRTGLEIGFAFVEAKHCVLARKKKKKKKTTKISSLNTQKYMLSWKLVHSFLSDCIQRESLNMEHHGI